MAVSRNQVAISGFADPYGKLSGTFKDLSTMYADKYSKDKALRIKEEELARQRALDLENSRRWGVERGDVLANRQREKARDLENTRRYEDGKKRQEDADTLAKEIRDKDKKRLEVIWGLTNAKPTYSIEAHPELIRGNINDQYQRINNDEALTTEFLNSNLQGAERTAALSRIGESRRNLYSGLNEVEKDKKIADFVTRLDALSRELSTIPMPNARKGRIEAFKQNQYGILKDRLQAKIKSGDALTIEEKRDYLFSQLTPEQQAVATPEQLGAAIAASAKGKSKADFISTELATVERAEKLDQQRIDNLLRWEKDGFSDNPTVASVAAADKSMNELDIGGTDTPNAKAIYNAIKATGVAPAFAASFVLGKISTNFLGSSIADPLSVEGKNYITEAKTAYDKMKETYSKGSRNLTKDDITPTTFPSRSLEKMQLDRFNVERGTAPIRVTPMYLKELTARTEKAAANMDNTDVDVSTAELAAPEANIPANVRNSFLSGPNGSRVEAIQARNNAREKLNQLITQREALPGFSGRGSAAMLNNKRAELDEQIRIANSRLDAIKEVFRARRNN